MEEGAPVIGYLIFQFLFSCFLFLKNLFIYFNWRLITLQYCGGFCHTSTCVSHGCTCVPVLTPPPPYPPHPSGLSRSTSFVCPDSCIELAHRNIHITMCEILPFFKDGNSRQTKHKSHTQCQHPKEQRNWFTCLVKAQQLYAFQQATPLKYKTSWLIPKEKPQMKRKVSS